MKNSTILSLCISLCLLGKVQAQEICNNGIDDDGDGVTDILDPDCICGELIPDIVDGDFEDYACCPQGITAGLGSGMYCLDDGWGLANSATADYFNTCGWVGGMGIPFAPMPIPSGDGAVGMISSPDWNEHVGLCMPFSMIPGEQYDISFYVGFNELGSGGYNSNLNVEFTLYGSDNCDNLPSAFASCMSNDPDWYEMESFNISGSALDTWQFFSTTFSPTAPAQAIAIGHSCAFALANQVDYHFIDNIVIDGVFVEIMDDFEADVSGDCVNGVFLEAADGSAVSYQWYLDGVLVPGATSNPYLVPVDANGVYQVFMEFADGTCAVSVEVPVVTDLYILDILGDVESVACPGDTDGSISIMSDTPNLPVDIIWDNGETTATIENLEPGNYNVTLTDANGCIGLGSFTVTVPPDLTLTVYTEQPTEDNPFGFADLTIDGGTPPYDIAWDNGNDVLSDDMLLPGLYTVVVLDDRDCEVSITFEIFEPLSAVVVFEPESCLGFCNGFIEIIEINGGALPFDINWNINGSSALQENLCEGPYDYVITDVNGTQISGTVVLEPGTDMELSLDYQAVLCEMNGTTSIDLEVIGGTEPFEFNWYDGSTSEDIDLAESGFYGVTVNDASGCEIITDFYIDFSNPIQVSDDTEIAPCGSQGQGSINITVFGGTPPYDFDWSNGEDTEDLSDLFAGIYNLTITDLYGCSFEGSFEVESNTDLIVSGVVNHIVCPTDTDGTISLDIQGGTAPITVTWSDGSMGNELLNLTAGQYNVTVTDALNCTWINSYDIIPESQITVDAALIQVDCFGESTGQIDLSVTGTVVSYSWDNGADTEDLLNVPAGAYNLMIEDNLGCNYSYAFEITEQAPIAISESIDHVDCFGEPDGSIEVQPLGSETYNYLWDNGEISNMINNQLAGSYDLTVSDALGCEQFYNFIIEEPDEINSNAIILHAGCDADVQGGSIEINPSGGIGPYDINWSNGQTNLELLNLMSGIYGLTIEDSQDCSIEEMIEVNAAVPFSIEEEIIDALCFEAANGEILIDVIGGAAPFEFVWSNGALTEDIEQLLAGIYELVVTDGNGCEQVHVFELDQPAELIVEAMIENARCFGETGMIELTVSGGVGPYNITWSDGTMGNQFSGLAGSYNVMVTDANACMMSFNYPIGEPDALVGSIQGFSLPSASGNDGTATISIIGGTEPYEVSWSNGAMGETIDDLDYGVYLATIIDANGCETSVELVLDAEDMAYTFVIDPNLCFEDCTGSVELIITGGQLPYNVTWNNGNNGDINSTLCAGAYEATITDAVGSELFTEVFQVTEPPEFVWDAQLTEISCIDEMDGAIDIMHEGGTSPFDYLWSNGETAALNESLGAGFYTLTVTDANQCEYVEVYELGNLTALAVEFVPIDADCDSELGMLRLVGSLDPDYTILIDGIEQVVSADGIISGLSIGMHELSYQIGIDCEVALGQFEIEGRPDIRLETDLSVVEIKLEERRALEITINTSEPLVEGYTITWESINPIECVALDASDACVAIELVALASEQLTVILTDGFGCETRLNIDVRVIEPPVLVMPNIFSPNGDSENEQITLLTSSKVLDVRLFQIYDRWGSLVHRQEAGPVQMMVWDGTMDGQRLDTGVYIYQVELNMLDGTVERFVGDLTLIR